jgi:hypothetical protein
MVKGDGPEIGPFEIPETPPEVLESYRQWFSEKREEFAHRSGIDPDMIDVRLWLLCEPWLEAKTECNCAYALCTKDDVPLPDHVCDGALATSVEWYLARHRVSSAGVLAEGWDHITDIPDDATVFCVVERKVLGGRATLFGVMRPIPGEPVDSDGYVPAYYDDCVVRIEGNGADLEHRLRSWYGRLFRGHRVGRPAGTRWGRVELRHVFEEALKYARRQHMKITRRSIAVLMGVSESTLKRAMSHGVIPPIKDWDSLSF